MDLSDLEDAAEGQAGESFRAIREFCDKLIGYDEDGYTWGYTIFRTAYYDGSDAEFARAMEILKECIHFECYECFEDDPDDDLDYTPNQQIVTRFMNDIVDAPELEGAAIAEVCSRFRTWIVSRGREIGQSSRYQFCLLVDEEVLKALVNIPTPITEDIEGEAVFSMKVIDAGDADDEETDQPTLDTGDASEEYPNIPRWEGWMWAAPWDLTNLWFFLSQCQPDEMFTKVGGRPLLLASKHHLGTFYPG